MASSSSPMRTHTILRGLRTVDDYTSGGPLPAASSGAIAQLGERLDRTQEVAGSSPASSISKGPCRWAGWRRIADDFGLEILGASGPQGGDRKSTRLNSSHPS